MWNGHLERSRCVFPRCTSCTKRYPVSEFHVYGGTIRYCWTTLSFLYWWKTKGQIHVHVVFGISNILNCCWVKLGGCALTALLLHVGSYCNLIVNEAFWTIVSFSSQSIFYYLKGCWEHLIVLQRSTSEQQYIQLNCFIYTISRIVHSAQEISKTKQYSYAA